MPELEPNTTLERLEAECASLREEVSALRELVGYLAFSKQTNPELAFFDWLVRNDVIGEKRVWLELVLSTLSDRLAGRSFTFTKPLPTYLEGRVYVEAAPTHAEARQLLMLALRTDNADVVDELFQALSSQGMSMALTDWWNGQNDQERRSRP